MSTFLLVTRELRHGRANAALIGIGVASAVALFVVFFSAGKAREDRARVYMRDLGYNLRIISKTADMERFWLDGYCSETFPQDYIHRLARTEGLTYNHLIGRLERKVDISGRSFLLTGLSPEYSPPGKSKPPMIFEVPAGAVYLGHDAARHLGKGKGDRVEVLGRAFDVVEVVGEAGSSDDIRVWGALGDVQGLLGAEQRLSEIQALDCLCLEPDKDPLTMLRAQLDSLLPDTRLVHKRNLAEARAKQRRTLQRENAFLLPAALLGCAAWVALLMTLNVRQRSPEIGVLRALGRGSASIAYLFLGKAAVLGVAGAAVGFAVGCAVAVPFAPGIFKVPAESVRLEWLLLPVALVAAPLVCAVASLVPAMLAVTRDPAEVLRGE